MGCPKNLQVEMLKFILKDLNVSNLRTMRVKLMDMGYSEPLTIDGIGNILDYQEWAEKIDGNQYKYVGKDIKSHRDKNTLKEMYNYKNMSMVEIDNELNVDRQTVSRWLKKYGLKRGV